MSPGLRNERAPPYPTFGHFSPIDSLKLTQIHLRLTLPAVYGVTTGRCLVSRPKYAVQIPSLLPFSVPDQAISL